MSTDPVTTINGKNHVDGYGADDPQPNLMHLYEKRLRKQHHPEFKYEYYNNVKQPSKLY